MLVVETTFYPIVERSFCVGNRTAVSTSVVRMNDAVDLRDHCDCSSFGKKGWRPVAEKDNGHIVETAREARGAEPGPAARNVLVWSLGLVVVALVIVYLLFFKS